MFFKQLTAFALGGLVVGAGSIWAQGIPKPLKISAAQASGPIFNTPGAVHNEEPGSSHVTVLDSKDGRFKASLYKAGAGEFKFDSYPFDEFLYLLSGTVKLTSADGSVLEFKAGDAVAIPKGWKGTWASPGYSEYYTEYHSDN